MADSLRQQLVEAEARLSSLAKWAPRVDQYSFRVEHPELA